MLRALLLATFFAAADARRGDSDLSAAEVPSTRAANGSDAPDEASWLQVAADVRSRANSSAKSRKFPYEGGCSCLEWKDAYYHVPYNLQCGSGFEFAFLDNQKEMPVQPILDAYNENLGMCVLFFKRIEGNSCINVNMGYDYGQWCYVMSSECSELNGGQVMEANPLLSTKKCKQGEDRMLRDLSPKELSDKARQEDLDLGLLMKMSYVLWDHGTWDEVETFWGFGEKSMNDFAKEYDGELLYKVKGIADDGIPYVYDVTENHHPPHRVTVGMTVYSVEPNPNLGNLYHPGQWNVLKCLTNCT
jgi:hypothetical protein